MSSYTAEGPWIGSALAFAPGKPDPDQSYRSIIRNRSRLEAYEFGHKFSRFKVQICLTRSNKLQPIIRCHLLVANVIYFLNLVSVDGRQRRNLKVKYHYRLPSSPVTAAHLLSPSRDWRPIYRPPVVAVVPSSIPLPWLSSHLPSPPVAVVPSSAPSHGCRPIFCPPPVPGVPSSFPSRGCRPIFCPPVVAVVPSMYRTHLDDVGGLRYHDGQGAGSHAGHHAGGNVDVVLAGTCQRPPPVTVAWESAGGWRRTADAPAPERDGCGCGSEPAGTRSLESYYVTDEVDRHVSASV